MLTELFLSGQSNLQLNEVSIRNDATVLKVSSSAKMGICPDCHHPSQRVHSRYWRTIADLSCLERPTRLNILAHRFFRDNVACEHKIFAERFEGGADDKITWELRVFITVTLSAR